MRLAVLYVLIFWVLAHDLLIIMKALRLRLLKV
jgi:hypothetical protein